MIKIIVASKGAVKVNAVKEAFSQFYSDDPDIIQGVAVSSDTRAQSITEAEIAQLRRY